MWINNVVMEIYNENTILHANILSPTMAFKQNRPEMKLCMRDAFEWFCVKTAEASDERTLTPWTQPKKKNPKWKAIVTHCGKNKSLLTHWYTDTVTHRPTLCLCHQNPNPSLQSQSHKS